MSEEDKVKVTNEMVRSYRLLQGKKSELKIKHPEKAYTCISTCVHTVGYCDLI